MAKIPRILALKLLNKLNLKWKSQIPFKKQTCGNSIPLHWNKVLDKQIQFKYVYTANMTINNLIKLLSRDKHI